MDVDSIPAGVEFGPNRTLGADTRS
jgi:hypothetical protein